MLYRPTACELPRENCQVLQRCRTLTAMCVACLCVSVCVFRYGSGANMFSLDAAKGGSPWGAGTLAGPDGSRNPSEVELEQAEYQVGTGGGGGGVLCV